MMYITGLFTYTRVVRACGICRHMQLYKRQWPSFVKILAWCADNGGDPAVLFASMQDVNQSTLAISISPSVSHEQLIKAHKRA